MHRVACLGPATEQAIITHSNEHVRTADRQALPPVTRTHTLGTDASTYTNVYTHKHFMLQCRRDPSTTQQADRLHTVALY